MHHTLSDNKHARWTKYLYNTYMVFMRQFLTQHTTLFLDNIVMKSLRDVFQKFRNVIIKHYLLVVTAIK